ncbi:zinc finger MYM-type protein 1-like [Salvia splendens]|uniref:zinc finger MYM-type protein 1-like n=1 Tax=Salvia splendens TaxID=180675 RepID=UPI001C278BAC|nr:zinc finger MYM-type protein 1-like [Salvia splendens]
MSKRRKTHDSSSSPASSSLPSSSPASSTPLSSFPASSTPLSSSPPSSSPASNSIGIVSPLDVSVPLHEEELIYDIEKLHHDPIRRTDIMKYPPNERDTIRRAYILRKPCQPRTFSFPQKEVGGSRHRFMVSWFDKWDWLEYSMDEDAAFCFVCYLFKNEVGHAGDNVRDVINNEYNDRLKASISCLRYLLGQGMAFRGHREGEDSLNRGNFLDGNCQLTSPTIQKDIINCCAKETMKRIVDDLGDDYFAILADESSNVSQKEQLALCLRYVEKKRGKVVERFIGLVHVGDTTSLSLKSAIMTLLVEHSLSPSKIRGQGYDGASNMKGEIHGLKTLIMKDTPSAYYVHCFAHQLQLTLVAISKKNDDCSWLFETVSILLNVIGVSCKRNELHHEIQAQKVAQASEIGELESGSGLNQELSLKRPGDTRWSSHYKTLLNIMDLFSTIFEVLTMIGKKYSVFDDKGKAQGILYLLESFDFVFMAQLMTTIFGYTNNLCLALQRRDQNIINAMRLVTLTKDQLQKMREDGWEIHLNKYSSQSCHLKQSQSRQPEAGKIKEVDLQQQPRPYGYKAIKFATKKKAKRMANAAVAEAILRLEKLVISQGGEMAQTR